ncbi:MAG TPA: hypothetical protein VMU95_09965 [Trebonia sp.]|nr:hypothetical protein [Trebonia sp.]
MPAGAILAIIIICVLIAIAAGTAATLELRMMATRRQFGPEFDRLERQVGPRQARAELIARRRRVAGLDLHPLAPERSREILSQWDSVQEEFVESPATSVATAAKLVLSAASERGYPADDAEQLLADLSVAHARQLEGFRRAQQAAADPGTASTEDLRQALLGYRALLYKLAGGPDTGEDGRGLRWVRRPADGTPANGGRQPSSGPQPSTRPSLRLSAPRLPRWTHSSQREGANQS